MAIKPQAYDIYFSTRPEERKLAERLDDAFDITYGDRLADCSVWFADPHAHTRERFGLRHEILVIVSQNTKTDSRIFRIIRDINSRYRHRLDPVLVLLIHRGDPVVIRDLLRSDPERVIVPITVDELVDAPMGSQSIRRRIAEYFGNTDLFDMASPITSDKYFFGRDTLVQELVVRSTTRGEHTGVFGLRKTGKTSVLIAVVRRVSKGPVLAEYIDCHGPGVHSARRWQALQNIVERLQSKLFTEHKRSTRVGAPVSEQPRPSVTLSGGETFLASLSLALGLMELAGRSGGRLDSFFLDEGFGSLDAVTLDLALAELGRRASRGRLVALISHVLAVAENIDDVLKVRRAPDGNSEAGWLEPSGDQEVDAELVKAALTAAERR